MYLHFHTPTPTSAHTHRGSRNEARGRASGPARERAYFFVPVEPGFTTSCDGEDGEPVAAGGGTGLLVLGDADGVVVEVEAEGIDVEGDADADGLVDVLVDAVLSPRCDRVSESRRPVTFMFSAF